MPGPIVGSAGAGGKAVVPLGAAGADTPRRRWTAHPLCAWVFRYPAEQPA
ncbi:hypothetical protein ACFC06_01920 [Nocardia sp. NPDC056064]